MGQTYLDLFQDHKNIQDIFQNHKESAESELEIQWKDAFYQANLKRLYKKNGKFMGWLLVFSDITRSKLIEKDLLELNEMKSKFFGIVAHDLVGHVRALSLTSQVLKDHYQSMKPEDVHDASDLIFQSSEAMNKFIQELLAWSKSQIQSFVMQKKSFSASKWVQDVLDFIEPVAAAKQVRLLKSVPDDLLLQGDPNMLSTVLRNLVENGVKNSPIQGLLQVRVGSGDNKIVISVTNQNHPTQTQISGDFFKIGNLSFQYSSNQGLGLYLCQDFVARHNGDIWATTLPDGKGMKFSFSLPTI